jgi:Transposase DDE domain
VGAMEMVRQWRATVKDLLCSLHGHQINALAVLSWAMAVAGHCHSGRVAAMMPGMALPASRQRRLERFLANPAVDAAGVMDQLAKSLLGGFAGCNIILILDETTRALPAHENDPAQGNSLCCMKLSLGYRKRALPLAFFCYRTRQLQDQTLPEMVVSLLERLAAAVPRGCQITLLADRGLCWPVLIDFCQEQQWHYVFRLQGQTAVRLAAADESTHLRYANQLAPRRGTHWSGENIELFKTAGWRVANVMATWEHRCKEPWLLVTDLPASYARCRGYAKRCWCEQMHRDEKSSGFQWRASHVEDPEHAQRLLVVMALAMLLAISTGSFVLKQGLAHQLYSRHRRMLSIFQLGVRWLRNGLVNSYPPIAGLHLYPP